MKRKNIYSLNAYSSTKKKKETDSNVQDLKRYTYVCIMYIYNIVMLMYTLLT